MADISTVITLDNVTDSRLLNAAVISTSDRFLSPPYFKNDNISDLTSEKNQNSLGMRLDKVSDLTSKKTFLTAGMKMERLSIHKEPIPIWEGGSVMDYRLFPTIDRTGIIFGTVKLQGVLQKKARVSLYFRKTGALIQSTFTDENGAFLFQCGLNRNVSDYYAVAITDEPFNAQIFDKLTPA